MRCQVLGRHAVADPLIAEGIDQPIEDRVIVMPSNGGNHAALLKTGFFYGATRSRIIEGSPEPPEWLELFETDLQDPLTAYARACDALKSQSPADGVRQRSSRPFVLVAAHQPSM